MRWTKIDEKWKHQNPKWNEKNEWRNVWCWKDRTWMFIFGIVSRRQGTKRPNKAIVCMAHHFFNVVFGSTLRKHILRIGFRCLFASDYRLNWLRILMGLMCHLDAFFPLVFSLRLSCHLISFKLNRGPKKKQRSNEISSTAHLPNDCRLY